ncbi:MAG: TetR/AcrR family transcriptional regulator [Bacteroidales bacterium]|jgi:AcrR family transcriptional regulator|nr:TetR/AcrR family transcriptional regulator [Bacteroidales bacterium]OJX92535.1 MAG: TetR family transcriptional regulator [Paludibacter sp. 47-17]
MPQDIPMEQLIVETAERLFLEKGFAMTSTTEIAKEIGCNQALVHYYFRTKAKLFEAIFEKKIKLFIGPFIDLYRDDVPFEEYLRSMIEKHFDLIKANPKIPFLFFNEMLTNPARMEYFRTKLSELPRSVLAKMEGKLQAEIAQGHIRPLSTFDLMISIFSLNVTLFMMAPMVQQGFNLSDREMEQLIEHRKSENVLIILRSLRPLIENENH